MRNFIDIVSEIQGCWVLPDGIVIPCDHKNDLHHADIAMEYFDIETDDDDDDSARDEGLELAKESGWIQISFWAKYLSITWAGRASQRQISIVDRIINDYATATGFSVSHGNTYADTRDFHEFSDFMKRELRKS